jgi:hypothetical protein
VDFYFLHQNVICHRTPSDSHLYIHFSRIHHPLYLHFIRTTLRRDPVVCLIHLPPSLPTHPPYSSLFAHTSRPLSLRPLPWGGARGPAPTSPPPSSPADRPSSISLALARCNTPCFCSVVICTNDPLNYSSNYS